MHVMSPSNIALSWINETLSTVADCRRPSEEQLVEQTLLIQFTLDCPVIHRFVVLLRRDVWFEVGAHGHAVPAIGERQISGRVQARIVSGGASFIGTPRASSHWRHFLHCARLR